MNPNKKWYQYKSDVLKAVSKWVKHGIASSQIAREELFYKYSCVLPSDGSDMLHWNHNIIDADVTAGLEGLQILNWSQTATRLYAIEIPEDKQSFSHSISVSLWGIPDTKGVVNFLIKTTLNLHSRVWEIRFNQNTAFDRKIDDLKSNSGRLLPEHIFILCNILRRPIIIISDEDKNMSCEVKHDATHFQGIYLPIMSKPINCSKTPVFLAYYHGCFSPLVIEAPIDESTGKLREKYSVSFPLVKCDFGLFSLKFLQASEEMRAGEILQDYLIVKDTDLPSGDGFSRILFTYTECFPLPEDKNAILDFIKSSVQSNGEKLHSQSKLPLKTFKSSARSIGSNLVNRFVSRSNDRMQNMTLRGDHFFVGQQHQPNHPGIAETKSPVEPTAPDMLEETQEPLSMTNERCVLCKSFRSSVKTFPFCHECSERRNEMIRNQEQKKDIETAHQPYSPTILTSVSDQEEQVKSYSAKNSKSFSNSSKESTNDEGKKEQSLADTLTGVGELSVPQHSLESNNNFDKVSCQSYSDQQNQGSDLPKICASPVCMNKVSGSEVLCERCIKILKVHNLSNCNKTCCYDLVPEVNSYPENVVCDMKGNQDIAMTANDFISNSPRTENKEMGGKSTLSNSNVNLCDNCSKTKPISPNHSQDTFGMQRNLSVPETPSQDKFGMQRNLSVPESPREVKFSVSPIVSAPEDQNHDFEHYPRPYQDKSTSLMVTSLTSIGETNHMLNILSGCGGVIRPNGPDSEEMSVVVNNDVKHTSLHSSKSVVSINGGPSQVLDMGDEKRIANGQSSLNASKRNATKPDDYHQTLEYLENNLRKDVKRCKSPLCSNYGSKQKDGYCNKCYNVMQRGHFHDHGTHQCDWSPYGIDQCDGETSSVGYDQIDGLHSVDDSFGYHTMQSSSTSDSSDFLLSDNDLGDI